MGQNIHIGQRSEQIEQVNLNYIETQDFSAGGRLNAWFIDHSSVNVKERVTFFRLLATMINAGLSLVKSFTILSDQTDNPKLKKVCDVVRADIELGKSLSSSMRKFPDVFEDSQIGMLHSGEASGKLNQVLLQIADQMEATAKTSGKIKGAMMYPMAIIFVIIVVFGAVTMLVIPGLKETFDDAGAALPASTQMLINISDALLGSTLGLPNWILSIILAAVLFFLLGRWKKTKNGKFYWNKFMLSVPIFGNLTRKVALSRFCRSIATLLKSGISITKALSITADVVGSEVYRRRIELISDDVSQGITIAENIRGQKKMWPTMLVSMIGVGEQTAQLDNISEKLADFYDEEVENIVKNLTSLMEPIIILLIGGVVGFLVSAIMSPIMSMSDVVAG